ncbi:MAG: FimB/Mfa2 family fimbrial subunit [Mucinivorans sp.]
MKQLFSLMAMMSVIAFISCQKETQSDSDAEPGLKDISISVNAGNSTRAAIDGTAEEKKIEKLTVVVYDKNGKYLKNQNFTNVTTTISINAIPEYNFPVKIFAIANAGITGKAWAASVTDWSTPSFTELSTLILLHKTVTSPTLVQGGTPLIMCGEVASVAATATSVEIPMTRPVIRVRVTNKSSLPISSIAFAGLNAAATKGSYEMNGVQTFTYSNSIPLGVGAEQDFYFMPQSASASITVTSTGVATKTKNLTAVSANHYLPITITDKSIDLGTITINIPEKWEEDPSISM